MNEKSYKTINSTGTISLIMGILSIVIGVTAGVLLIINGARLLKLKGEVLIGN